MQIAIAENSWTALDQNGYERRYADITEKHNTIKSEWDRISEQIDRKHRGSCSRDSFVHWKSRLL